MSNVFINLSTSEKNAWISRAADQLELPEIIIEKDFWLCWTFEELFSLPIQMAFKGGTSLSKAYGIINRFSGAGGEFCRSTPCEHTRQAKERNRSINC